MTSDEPMTVRQTDYNDFVCMFNYSDGTANYKRGDKFKLGHTQTGGDYMNPQVWVWPETGHPVKLDAFEFCFIWAGDWKGEEL